MATWLTGHSIAEEAALYPGLARADAEGYATNAYTQQSAAKLQIGLLQDLAPMSQDFDDKLEHIRGAVLHHVYEEESNWFIDLKNQTPAAEQAKLTQPYQEQFSRYLGEDSDVESQRLVG